MKNRKKFCANKRRAGRGKLKTLWYEYNATCCYCGNTVAHVSTLKSIYGEDNVIIGDKVVRYRITVESEWITWAKATTEHTNSLYNKKCNRLENLRLACGYCNHKLGTAKSVLCNKARSFGIEHPETLELEDLRMVVELLEFGEST